MRESPLPSPLPGRGLAPHPVGSRTATEAGEETTVSGRPVATLGPVRSRQWVRGSELAELAKLPPDPTLMDDIEKFGGGDFYDPWSDR